MGVNASTAAVIAHAMQSQRHSGGDVLTIGHLNLTMSVPEQSALFEQYADFAGAKPFATNGYADDFLRLITRADRVMSLDYSDYEQCDIVHDLNQPIDPSFYDRFDAVIDGGVLEHIFNVPAALNTYAALTKPGGSIFIATVANNHMGHGFYQFSPELFFNYFSAANGFDLQRVTLIAHPYPSASLSPRMRVYDVVDPKVVGGRVGLVCGNPVMIVVHALKRSSWRPGIPQLTQSDYATIFEGNEDNRHPATRASRSAAQSLKRWMSTHLPAMMSRLRGAKELREYSFTNSKMYRPRELARRDEKGRN